jgi:hypothetical protein
LTDGGDDAPKKTGRKRAKRPTGRPPKETSPKEIARKERVADIMSLRLQGWSLDAIGEAQTPRISSQRVHQIIVQYLAETATLATEQVRKVELRLDEMLVKVYENAVKGDLLSIDRVLAIHDRRAKMTGINAPVKVQTEEVGPVSDAKASLLAKWNKMAERMRAAEIAAPMKDVTPLIEHEPSAEANETDMIRFADVTKSAEKPAAPTLVTEVERVTKNSAGTGRVTKPAARSVSVTPPVTKKGGRPANGERAMTPAEKQRAFRERQKAAKAATKAE